MKKVIITALALALTPLAAVAQTSATGGPNLQLQSYSRSTSWCGGNFCWGTIETVAAAPVEKVTVVEKRVAVPGPVQVIERRVEVPVKKKAE